jgi:alanine racemase
MQRKPLRKGEATSYSKLFVAPHDMEIAILAMGYAEGLSQSMTNKINCIVGGVKTPLVGQICMNLCIADVTNIRAERGDEVVLIGKQGNEEIRVADIAQQTGIRHHEVMTRLGKSIPKVYLREPIQTPDRVRAPEV